MKVEKLVTTRQHLSVNRIPYGVKKKARKNQQQIRDILSSELSKLTYFLRPFRKQVLNACNEIFMHLERNEGKF